MTTFYICRHGQTENNKNMRLSGWIDTPLTDEGVHNAAVSASKLFGIQFDAIISSDLGRAFVTAYIISNKLNYITEIYRSKGLREVSYGELANARIASYPALTAVENENYVPPDGESLAQMQHRVMACIDELSKENPLKTVLLVAHDGTINAVYASFANQNIGKVDATRDNAHDFVAKFVYDGGAIVSFEEVAAK